MQEELLHHQVAQPLQSLRLSVLLPTQAVVLYGCPSARLYTARAAGLSALPWPGLPRALRTRLNFHTLSVTHCRCSTLQERQEERGAEDSEDVTAASVVSLPASSIAAPSSAAASSEAAAPSSPTGQQAEDSPGRGSGPRAEYPPALEGLLSAGSRASAGSAGMGGGVGSGALAPRTPHGGGGWLAPADVVAPLRDFASEVAAEVSLNDGPSRQDIEVHGMKWCWARCLGHVV